MSIAQFVLQLVSNVYFGKSSRVVCIIAPTRLLGKYLQRISCARLTPICFIPYILRIAVELIAYWLQFVYIITVGVYVPVCR